MPDIFRQNNAKAIWKDAEKKQNRYVKFQTKFVLKDEQEVLFYICTDTQYELYINGSLASFGQYGDFPLQKTYDCVDISSLVRTGENLVSVLAFSNGKNSLSHMSGLPMLIFTATSKGKCLLSSDDTVKCSEETEFVSGKFENITEQLSYNFGFDLRKDDGFREKDVSETWENAVICDDSAVRYTARPIPKTQLKELCCGEMITQGEFLASCGETVAERMQFAYLAYREKGEVLEERENTFALKKDNVFWICDLGEEMAGQITIDVEASEGAILDIAYGEHLSDMRVRSAVGGRNFAFRTVCREGRQKITFCIHRLAGRYLEVFACGGVQTVHAVGLRRVEYPLHYNELHFQNGLYNKIYEASQRTLMLCMHDHYEDCPWREQALYGMDSRNQMLAGYYAFGETDMPRASLKLLAQSQRDYGLLEMTAPSLFQKTIPSFSLAWVCALSEYVLFSGDLSFGEEMLPVAKKILAFFETDTEKNLIITPSGDDFWHLYEWAEGMNVWGLDGKLRYDAPLNAFFMLSLRNYERLSRWLNKEAETLWAQEKIERIYQGFHKAFYCEDKKAYQTYLDGNAPQFSQLTQAWALCGRCVPEECQAGVRANLLNDELTACSLSHSVYKYDALMQDSETYADYVLSELENKWGHMLYSGATTFWETMDGERDFEGAGSLCHGWSATPAYLFWRYVVGLYPTEPGCGNVSAKPLCGNTFRAKGSLKTPAGFYRVCLENGKTQVEI